MEKPHKQAHHEPAHVPTKREQVEKAFTYHSPSPEQVITYQKIRDQAKAFALFLLDHTPESREQSLALTELETCVMFANASIARN